ELDDPERAVAGFDGPRAVARIGEARPHELHALALELGHRPWDLGRPEQHSPGAHLVVDLARGLRPVDRHVVLAEGGCPRAPVGLLRIAGVAGGEPLEDLW